MRESVVDLVHPLEDPRVPTVCIHGMNVSTPETFTYGEKFPDAQPTTKNGPGDGTVNEGKDMAAT